MLTLVLSLLGDINVPEIVGYILAGAEVLLVLLGILRCFVPPTTKFGKWLRWSATALEEHLHHKQDDKSNDDQNHNDDENKED